MNPTRKTNLCSRMIRAPGQYAPEWMMLVGGALAAVGAVTDLRQVGYSYLLAFMFWLSVSLGALGLVMVHHLFDAGWSVPVRRLEEHLAGLLYPWLAMLFVPVLLLAKEIYPWLSSAAQADPAVQVKYPLFTKPGFVLASALCFGVWGFLSGRLRHWSLVQDAQGGTRCAERMRFHSAWGVFGASLTLSLAAVLWMKALMHPWFSAIYGVYFFAESLWAAVATVFLLMMILARPGVLGPVLTRVQYHFFGRLFLAMTLLYAYIHFCQYFIIWNGNIPEETFWYVIRQQGSWSAVGLAIILGHFLLPFLVLLRMEVKCRAQIMVPLCLWALLMHYVDLAFNILPARHPNGFPVSWVWLDLGCLALVGGVLTRAFQRNFLRHAPYPVKDPRLGEALGLNSFHDCAIAEDKPAGGTPFWSPASSAGENPP